MTPPGRALQSTLVISSTRLAAAVLAVVSGTLSAGYFGTSVEKDCYIVAQTLPSIVTYFAMAGVYTTLLMMLADIGRSEGTKGQIHLTARTLMYTSLPILPLLALALIIPRPLIALLAPGFGPAQIDLASGLLRITCLTILGDLSLAMVRCLFETRRQFALPAVFGLLVPGASLVFLVALVRPLGIYALAIGQPVGGVLAVGILWVLAVTRLHDPPGFSPSASTHQSRSRHQSRIWRSFIPMMLATAFGQVNLLIDNAFASALPTGSITILAFAYVIISNAQLLTVYVIVQVAFPRMVHEAIDDPAGLLDTVRTHMRYLLLVAAPMAAGALTFGLPLARALFERGAFPASSSRGVSTALACYAAHILLLGHLLLLARLLIVRGRLVATALISAAAIALNALLDWLLMRPMGLYGIALSTTLVTTAYFLVLVPLALKETPGLFARSERLHAAKVMAGAAAMGLFLRGWEAGFERIYSVAGAMSRVLELGVGICLAGLFYLLLLRSMGVHEPMEVIRRFATGPRLLRNER